MSKVIKLLILSDMVLYFSMGLFAPILAIFITEQVPGGSIETVGIATGIYWLVRSLITIPLGRFMDRFDGEKDEFYFMISGTILMAVIAFAYILVSASWHIYLLEAVLGLAYSMAVPGWRILFTNHMDFGKIGYEWSMDDIAVGVGMALSSYLGAIIASQLGFKTLFIIMGFLGLIASAVLLPISKNIRTIEQLRKLRQRTCRELLSISKNVPGSQA